jgi:hypothetical protein
MKIPDGTKIVPLCCFLIVPDAAFPAVERWCRRAMRQPATDAENGLRDFASEKSWRRALATGAAPFDSGVMQ